MYMSQSTDENKTNFSFHDMRLGLTSPVASTSCKIKLHITL